MPAKACRPVPAVMVRRVSASPANTPRLQGQYADYIETQLKAFRAGERSNDPASMMRTVAIRMTDAEIKAVSDYAAGLRW